MFLGIVHRLRHALQQPMVNKLDAAGVCTPRVTAIRALDEEAHDMARRSDVEAFTATEGQVTRPDARVNDPWV